MVLYWGAVELLARTPPDVGANPSFVMFIPSNFLVECIPLYRIELGIRSKGFDKKSFKMMR